MPWNKQPWAPLVGIGAALAFAFVAVALANRSPGTAQPVKQGSGEIFRQPVASSGPNAFTASVSSASTTVSAHSRASPSPSSEASPSPSSESSPESGAVEVSSSLGDTPGLYGGTRQLTACDRRQLVTFLRQNPAKASAWVRAINTDIKLSWSGGTSVRIDQIEQFVNELTPVLLRSDTRVTNNGYVNGRPDPYQAVLEAGTAVLVDYYGIPRVRCACGNPLAPPVPVTTTPSYTGDTWDSFSPTTVVVVQPPPTIITNITIIDVESGQYFQRPTGSSGDRDGPPSDTPPETTETRSPNASPEPSETPSPSASPSPSPTSHAEATDVSGSYSLNISGNCFGAFSVNGTMRVAVHGTSIEITLVAPNGTAESHSGSYDPARRSFTLEVTDSGGSAHMDGTFGQDGSVTGSVHATSDSAACNGNISGHKQ